MTPGGSRRWGGERWVWFDLENTPHVHFLAPLITAVREAGVRVRVTARRQAQTIELAQLFGVDVDPVGGGDHRTTAAKYVGVLSRSALLAAWACRDSRPALLVSSSRTACIAAAILRVRSVALLDYEHAEQRSLATSEVIWLPDLLRDVALPLYSRRVASFYPGLKENLYLDGRRIDRGAERHALGIGEDETLVVARPPAETAHYATPRSTRLWLAAACRLIADPRVRFLVIPRTTRQRSELRALLAALPRAEILERAVDGPALVAAADLVVGGGGTMNREAAVLGTHVWSVFSGPRPAIDVALARERRLTWIENESDAAGTPLPDRTRRSPRGPFPEGLRQLAADILRRASVAALR